MFIMINQIAVGKTNHGRTLYGRATRHKDVNLCCIGALSFYLMYRIWCTKEFAGLTVEDWLDNSKWFDIKLLTDVHAEDNTKEMKNDSYGKHIKRILKKLNLVCDKLLHLGRNIGSRILEMLEEEMEGIRRMGQWNPSIFDTSYSTKLPMGPIRKLAGYNKMYFNTRTTVQPPLELLKQTPIGEWIYEVKPEVEARSKGKHPTACHVLQFLCQLNEVFMQDAAAMQVLHSNRADHPLFQTLPVFESDEFKASCVCICLFCFVSIRI
jgi:hypothetical protein